MTRFSFKMHQKKFSTWSKDNQIVVAVFMLLVGVDIKNLELLESGLKIDLKIFQLHFNAKVSDSEQAQNKMFWGTVTNTFIDKLYSGM